MKVIILCGGLGTRLKEETEYKPKAMVYIGNKPIIWHIMKIYSHYGYNEFILALGYKADYIKSFFLNQKNFTSDFTLNTKDNNIVHHVNKKTELEDFKITFADTGLDTPIGERILRCKKYIPKNDTDFMITYGDGVADVNIEKLVNFHNKHNKMGTILGVHTRSKFGLLKLGKNGIVNNFVEKPILSDWVNGGFMIFKTKFFEYLKKGEMEHPGLARIADKKQLFMYDHPGFWMAVDTYKELEDLNKIWKRGNPPWKIWQ